MSRILVESKGAVQRLHNGLTIIQAGRLACAELSLQRIRDGGLPTVTIRTGYDGHGDSFSQSNVNEAYELATTTPELRISDKIGPYFAAPNLEALTYQASFVLADAPPLEANPTRFNIVADSRLDPNDYSELTTGSIRAARTLIGLAAHLDNGVEDARFSFDGEQPSLQLSGSTGAAARNDLFEEITHLDPSYSRTDGGLTFAHFAYEGFAAHISLITGA